MKKTLKISSIVLVVSIIIGVVFAKSLFTISIIPGETSSLVVKDTAFFQDEYIDFVNYNFKITATIYLSSVLLPWERLVLKDSISVFNQKLMTLRFSGDYPEFWNSKDQVFEKIFPHENFIFHECTIDSVQYFLLIQRNIEDQIWKEKPPV